MHTSFEDEIELIRIAMVDGEPEDTAELQIERKMDWIVRELDELCRLASNPETVDLVDGQRRAVGQMKVRVDLIASFLMARKPPGLRIVKNG